MSAQLVGIYARRRMTALGLVAAVVAAAMAVIAAVSFNTHSAAGAGGGGNCFATTGPVCTFKSHTAFADFSTVSAFGGGGGCTVTDAFAQPFESLSMPGQNAAVTVIVSLSTFNFCNNTQAECASNFDPNSGAPLFTGTVQFGLDLTTATVIGTATMFDPCATTPAGASFTSNINLTWQAFGPNSTLIDNSHLRSPGFILNSRFKGLSRQAIASGVLTDATGGNRAASPTANADLENDSGGTVVLNHS